MAAASSAPVQDDSDCWSYEAVAEFKQKLGEQPDYDQIMRFVIDLTAAMPAADGSRGMAAEADEDDAVKVVLDATCMNLWLYEVTTSPDPETQAPPTPCLIQGALA